MAHSVYNKAAWRDARRYVLERDRGVCQMCGGRADVVDHIRPWRDGGAHYDPSNLRALCTSCNSSRVVRSRVIGLSPAPSRDWGSL